MELGDNNIIVECENDVYTAVLSDFVDYDKSPAGFGDDENEAVLDLVLQIMKGDSGEH